MNEPGSKDVDGAGCGCGGEDGYGVIWLTK
jgi:hypothetical protein